MEATVNSNQLILTDAHVHIHDCFKLEDFLDSAWHNFQHFAQQKGYSQNFQGVLCLTEIEGVNYFEQLVSYAQAHRCLNHWQLTPTQENISVYARLNPKQGIVILAGRQIVTAEKLEVLALISDRTFTSGLPLATTIEQIISQGAIPVIPWGFGKWLGKRGKLLNQLLQQPNIPRLFLGDSGIRPAWLPRPLLLQQAEQKGIKIISGTDPLALTAEGDRPGSFGFTVKGNLSLATPGEELKQILLDDYTYLKPYGYNQKPLRFIRDQLAIRWQGKNQKNTIAKYG